MRTDSASAVSAANRGPARSEVWGSWALTWTVALMVVASLTLAAKAEANQPFKISFDDNEISLGPISDLPIGQISRGASIEGTVDSQGRVRVPKAKFTLPVLGIDEPVKVRAFMGIESDATGTWTPATGKLEIQAKAGLWLSIDVEATIQALEGAGIDLGDLGPLASIIGSLGDLTCGFSPMDVTFTTETTSLGTGQRFTSGLNGPGSLTAEWSKLGPFAGKTRFLIIDVCSTLRSFAPSLISGLVGTSIPGLDLGGLDIAGLLNNLDNVDLGPSSLTIIRTEGLAPPSPPVISDGPASPTNSTAASFAFQGQSGATFQCRIVDSQPWSDCTSPKSYSGFQDGAHVFEVRQTDGVGRTSAGTSRAWLVDTVPPGGPTIVSGPPPLARTNSASISFSGEPSASFQCRMDSGPWAECSSPMGYSNLGDGAHSFEVRQLDPAGNSSATTKWDWSTASSRPVNLSFTFSLDRSRLIADGRAKVSVRVVNSGDQEAVRVRACTLIPRAVRIRGGCLSLGNLPGGRTASGVIALQAGRSTGSRQISMKLALSATGTATKTRDLKIRIVEKTGKRGR